MNKDTGIYSLLLAEEKWNGNENSHHKYRKVFLKSSNFYLSNRE